MNKLNASAAIAFLFVSGCVLSQETVSSDTMYIKAAELRKLSAAVESTIRYKEPSPALSDDELLKLATAHNPILLTSFQDFTVRVDRGGKHAILLVCTAEGRQALLEDAACTGPLDVHHWKSEGQPCEFTLQAASLC